MTSNQSKYTSKFPKGCLEEGKINYFTYIGILVNKKSILTPSKKEGSFMLTSSIDGRKTLNHITKTKKKKVHAAIGKIKGAQTSRNMIKISGMSSRMSDISKTNMKNKNYK